MDLGAGVSATAISANGDTTCALLSGGAVRCWGDNFFGQLGLGNTDNIGDNETPTTNVTLGVSATAVSVGFEHVCALLAENAIRCWGRNAFGQLGIANTTDIGDTEIPMVNVNLGGATPTTVSAGGAHTCTVITGGAVRCWGYNSTGQLGLANTTDIGDTENPTANVNLATIPATAVTSGADHTCALLNPAYLRCWGSNNAGQLGLGNTTIIGDNENPTLNTQLLGTTATAVAAGGNHSCALLGGAVRCWGYGLDGQLGLGNTDDIGDNESPTTNVNLGVNATAITAGDFHTCALLSGGAVRCWGYGGFGQLGLGNIDDIGDNESPTLTSNLGGATATAITAGDSHTCALLTGGAVRCWGYGFFGQLGLGNTTIIGDNELPTANVNLGAGATATAVTAGGSHTCALLSAARSGVGEAGPMGGLD